MCILSTSAGGDNEKCAQLKISDIRIYNKYEKINGKNIDILCFDHFKDIH